MVELSTQKRWQPWKGVILQAAGIIFLITAGEYMQTNWGYTGLVLTELAYLALAVIYTLVQKTPLREVFPIRKPSGKDLGGTALMGMGSLGLGLISLGLMAFLFPKLYEATTTGLSDFLSSKGAVVMFLVVSCLPCICEEAIERGAVLSHFRSIKKGWVIVLIMGIFFGINHWSIIRFLNTAIMGGTLTYLMVKRNNFLLPMLLHFSINASAVILSLWAQASMADNPYANTDIPPAATLASTLVIGCAAPLLLILGIMLFDDRKPRTRDEQIAMDKVKTRNILIATGFTCVFLITGMLMMLNIMPELTA